MKRVFSFILCLCVVFSLSGCASVVQDVLLDDMQLVTPPPEDDWHRNVVPRTKDPVFLAWEYRPTVFTPREGLDVLCPMWMELVMGPDGPVLTDLSEMGYDAFDPVTFVEEAHRAGTQVWATVVGFTPEATLKTVRSPETVEEVASGIAARVQAWGLDGIDLDFENMDPDDTERFTDFAAAVKEAIGERPLSVCVTVPMATASRSPYQAYDRKALAGVCDYVSVMTYDGHKEGIVAPVAGEDWVRYRLELLLREVPSTSILLGIPLHGVDFYRDADSADAFSGRLTVNYEQVRGLLETGTLTVGDRSFELQNWIEMGTRQEGSGILLYSFTDKDEAVHWIFLEDEVSLRRKVALVEEYSLGGAAVWQKRAGDERWWAAMAEAMEEIPGAEGD